MRCLVHVYVLLHSATRQANPWRPVALQDDGQRGRGDLAANGDDEVGTDLTAGPDDSGPATPSERGWVLVLWWVKSQDRVSSKTYSRFFVFLGGVSHVPLSFGFLSGRVVGVLQASKAK